MQPKKLRVPRSISRSMIKKQPLIFHHVWFLSSSCGSKGKLHAVHAAARLIGSLQPTMRELHDARQQHTAARFATNPTHQTSIWPENVPLGTGAGCRSVRLLTNLIHFIQLSRSLTVHQPNTLLDTHWSPPPQPATELHDVLLIKYYSCQRSASRPNPCIFFKISTKCTYFTFHTNLFPNHAVVFCSCHIIFSPFSSFSPLWYENEL